MRFLYVAELGSPWSSARQRMTALRELGHTVHAFDIWPYHTYNNRWVRAATQRMAWGPPLCAFNRDVLAYARACEYDWAWVDKGIWMYPETVAVLRERGRLAVHFTPDPALVYHRTRNFVRAIPQYDVCVTSKRYETEEYRAAGARRLIFQMQGFDHHVFQPHPLTHEERSRLSCDVIFVGHSEPHYAECVLAAARETPNVAVWGDWKRAAAADPAIRALHRGPGIFMENYSKALGAAKIALGLLSRLAPDRHTTRTFEIPASGGFLLAERTEEHQELFEDGKEAVFFDGLDELREKIRYYLAHESQRKGIAAAGRERCISGKYRYKDRLEKLIELIQSPPVTDSYHEKFRTGLPPPRVERSRFSGVSGWVDSLAASFGPCTTVAGGRNAIEPAVAEPPTS
jgi:hypothetical protein